MRQVLLVNRIRDIGIGQNGHIHIRQNAVQRTGDRSVYIHRQVAVNGHLSALFQLNRREAVGFQDDIEAHRIQVQTTVKLQERAVRSVDRQTVQIHLVMLHDNRLFAKTQLRAVLRIERGHA